VVTVGRRIPALAPGSGSGVTLLRAWFAGLGDGRSGLRGDYSVVVAVGRRIPALALRASVWLACFGGGGLRGIGGWTQWVARGLFGFELRGVTHPGAGASGFCLVRVFRGRAGVSIVDCGIG
jgi:hypothetical protein